MVIRDNKMEIEQISDTRHRSVFLACNFQNIVSYIRTSSPQLSFQKKGEALYQVSALDSTWKSLFLSLFSSYRSVQIWALSFHCGKFLHVLCENLFIDTCVLYLYHICHVYYHHNKYYKSVFFFVTFVVLLRKVIYSLKWPIYANQREI